MVGSTISHYSIIEKLGEGGMGVVYKAQDLTLDRLVALKFLPEHASAASGDGSRFIQETKAAAALNHPNVCTIHGIEEADGKSFIVMEFVDGQTLQEKKSTLSVKQAIDIGIQIAEGLAVAHEKGIVHRDIKPENIMIRKDGIVQVMDFGLAKLRGVTRLTKEGSTVGTAGYMSPEQVQGQEADHRSDIFSLGVLLYEMLTGQLPFKGMHETAVAYEIVNVDSPPPSAVNPSIPPELDAVVLDCLEKDPRERTQAASQVALELKRYRRESSRARASRITAARPLAAASSLRAPSTADGVPYEPAPSPSRVKARVFIAGGIVLALGAGFAAATFLRPVPSQAPTVRGTIDSPVGVRFNNESGGHTVISPNGTMLAFVGIDSLSGSALYIRPLNSSVATKLAGTENAEYPFWSPDNRSVGFFAGGKLKRVDVSGSPPLTLADAPSGRGGAWSSAGVIVYSPEINQKDLFVVSASGGQAKALTALDSASAKVPRYPFFLPDGKHFVFVRLKPSGVNAITREDLQAYVGGLDGTVDSIALSGASNMFYASGTLFYVRQSTLIGQPFDPETYAFLGEPVPFDKDVSYWPARAKGDFSVSENGVLVYGFSGADLGSELVFMDRDGRSTFIMHASPRFFVNMSPDESTLAFEEMNKEDGNMDIWLYDVNRKVKTRFTFNAQEDFLPVWSSDGSTVYFSSKRGGNLHDEVYQKDAGGTKDESVRLSLSGTDIWPTDVSRDGRYLLLTVDRPPLDWDLSYISLQDDTTSKPIVSTKFREGVGFFSPDGKWLAYVSNESGKEEVYVRPFLREGSQWQISSGGGNLVGWANSGEIFFTSSGSLVAVRADISGTTPKFAPPVELFRVGNETGLDVRSVTRDGKRFVVSHSTAIRQRNSHAVIVNWDATMENR